MRKWIVPNERGVSPEKVGRKAANLAFLREKGFLVPRTAFVVVPAFRNFLRHNRLLALVRQVRQQEEVSEMLQTLAGLRKRIERGSLPEAFASEIGTLLDEWKAQGVSALAVRSSSVKEDLEQQSFAGQYASLLNVPLTVNAVAQAVKKVWASLFSDAVWSYCREHHLSPPGEEMGVILQAMVPAQYAGVAFTRTPLQEDDDELLLEFVEGLGEKLVDGTAVPRQIRWKRKDHSFNAKLANERRLSLPGLPDFVQELLRLEGLVGRPVDVEWAFAGGRYYFLQFRPITTQENATVWSDENVGEVIPDVVTPFSWSILEPMTNGAYRYFLRKVGLRAPSEKLFALYEGKVYFNQTAFKKLLETFYLSTHLRADKSNWQKGLGLIHLAYLLLRVAFFLRVLPRRAARVRRLKRNAGFPASKVRIKELRACLKQAQNLMNVHVAVTIFAEIFYQALDKVCREWCPEQGIEASKLLQGIGEVESTRPAQALWEIGQLIRHSETYRPTVQKLEPDEIGPWVDTLSQGDPLRKALQLFFETYGHGALHEFELLYPRWAEDPSYIYRTLKNYVTPRNNGFDLKKHLKKLSEEKYQLEQKAETQLQKFLLRRFLFKYLLKKAEYFSFEREILKQALVRCFARLRQELVAIGKERLGSARAVFFLTWPEVQQLLRYEIDDGQIALKVRERQLLRQRQMQTEHPRRLKQWAGRWLPLDAPVASGRTLHGIACSAGMVEGRVRVVLQAEQGGTFEKGEILVTRATNPGWTPLLILAGGIITEIGGALSHGAIIAREFGIPMVAAVEDATKRLHTGQWVRLNGQTGTIEILEEGD